MKKLEIKKIKEVTGGCNCYCWKVEWADARYCGQTSGLWACGSYCGSIKAQFVACTEAPVI